MVVTGKEKRKGQHVANSTNRSQMPPVVKIQMPPIQEVEGTTEIEPNQQKHMATNKYSSLTGGQHTPTCILLLFTF